MKIPQIIEQFTKYRNGEYHGIDGLPSDFDIALHSAIKVLGKLKEVNLTEFLCENYGASPNERANDLLKELEA